MEGSRYCTIAEQASVPVVSGVVPFVPCNTTADGAGLHLFTRLTRRYNMRLPYSGWWLNHDVHSVNHLVDQCVMPMEASLVYHLPTRQGVQASEVWPSRWQGNFAVPVSAAVC